MKNIKGILIVAFGLLFSTGIVFAAELYRADQYSPFIINEFGICKRVSSSNGLGVFIPASSTPELNSFFAHPPANVDIADCVFGCTDSVANNYDSNANADDGSCNYISCDTIYHECSARFGDYDYEKNRSEDVVGSLWESCSISEYEYGYLSGGTLTRLSRDPNTGPNGCPQCWTDSWQYSKFDYYNWTFHYTNWQCSRSAYTPDYQYFQAEMDPITYHTSCTISDDEKTDLENQGYYDDGYVRENGPNAGEWKDTHYMTRCQ